MTNILIITGEQSGDLHGANLLNEIKNLRPDISFYGIGGENMIKAGLTALYNIKQLSFLGFTEIIKHLPFIRNVKKHLLSLVKEKNIKIAILIDYPGFNLNIAKNLFKMNLKIVYYISPQIWAWGQNRVKKIKKYISRMLVVFPFEKEFYKKYGIEADYVGHPLIERIRNYILENKERFIKTNSLDEKKEILLLMPGSREHEIKLILPELIDAAKEISRKYNLQIVIAGLSTFTESMFELIKEQDIKIVFNQTYELMKYSKFGIIKSGTSTLEAALFELPFIVVYKISKISYHLSKILIKLKSIAIPNIILGKNFIPELIQNNLTKDNLFRSVDELLTHSEKISEMKQEFSKIWNLLGDKSASKESAKIIVGLLNES